MLNQTNIQSTADISARASLQKIVSDSVGKGRLDRARDLGVRLYDLNIIRNGPGFDPKQIRFGNLSNAAAGDPEFVETFNEKKVISAVHVDSPAQLEQQNVEVLFAQLLGAGPQVKIVADAKTSTRPVDIILCLDASRSMNRTPEIGKNFPPGGNSIHES